MNFQKRSHQTKVGAIQNGHPYVSPNPNPSTTAKILKADFESFASQKTSSKVPQGVSKISIYIYIYVLSILAYPVPS